ncbi:MAG: PAS domain S-box protein [Deltaproteobacteria bacterium]|nr:MAG: PAS domain S-box protein [Deltaproteobacteria bacterium]
MNLQFLFDDLITSRPEFSDPEVTRKIKALNIFQLGFIMLAPLLGLFYFYLGVLSLFYVIIGAGLLMIPSVIILRKRKNILWVANYFIFILWATLFIVSWNTGAMSTEGVMSTSWLLNGGILLLAVFFNGYAWGAFWALLVLVQAGVVTYLFHMGYPFPNLIPSGISDIYSLGVFLVALLAIFLMAFLFEREKSGITNREQEKGRALTESKKYVDDILARSPVPTFIINEDHQVIQWNRACQEMTGIGAEEILGKEVWKGFSIDDQRSLADVLLEDPEFVAEAYGDTVRPGTESGWYQLEMFLPHLKGGSRALVTVAPVSDTNGNARGAIQTVQDITARQNDPSGIPNDLTEDTEELWVNPIFKIDSKGKISFWNKACEESFGYSTSQMLGKSPLIFLSKRHRDSFKKTIIRAFKGQTVNNKQWKYYKKGGEPVYVLAKAHPTEASEQKRKECIIVNTNITDLKLKMKELEENAQESKEQLENLAEEYDLLKKNIATYIRGKEKFNPNQ